MTKRGDCRLDGGGVSASPSPQQPVIKDSVTATNVYLCKDGETLRVIGEHTGVAEKLAMTPSV